MRVLQSATGSNRYGEIPDYDGVITDLSKRKAAAKTLITQANSVQISKIFDYYNLPINDQNKKATCPFPQHKNGRESSASFYYYPETNSFWCFGCKTGTKCCDFVAALDQSTKLKSAIKIIELFGDSGIGDNTLDEQDNFTSKLILMLEFSSCVRKFRQRFSDEKSESFIEKLSGIFDELNEKHALNNDAMIFVIDTLKNKINKYEQYKIWVI